MKCEGGIYSEVGVSERERERSFCDEEKILETSGLLVPGKFMLKLCTEWITNLRIY